jgi:hypothetical protein
MRVALAFISKIYIQSSSCLKVCLETSDVYRTCELVGGVANFRIFRSLDEGTIYTLMSSQGKFVEMRR